MWEDEPLDILERVCEIIADITQNSMDEITEQSSMKNVDGWDAISQINIMVAIEMDFGVSLLQRKWNLLTAFERSAAR